MRLLSLTQPLATLVALNKKRIETRSFKTPYRGLVAIHASGGWAGLPAIRKMRGLSERGGKAAFRELCGTVPFAQALTEDMAVKSLRLAIDDMPFGSIVAVAELVMCLPTSNGLFQLNAANIEIKNGKVSGSVTQVTYQKPSTDSNEFAFGNYADGRYMWFFEHIRRLRVPMEYKGALGLIEIDSETELAVRAAVGMSNTEAWP